MPRPLRKEIDLKHAFRCSGLGISDASGYVAIAGKRRRIHLSATFEGYTRRRLWHVAAYYWPPGAKAAMRAEVSMRDSVRWEAAEQALQGLALQIEENEKVPA